ncbi:MAG: T9SS type A sorting domain-containing protein [Ignavibacteria bacterium]|nr:T9SS type A sorting domain-containing protein [Ignavibacteria bacterium]
MGVDGLCELTGQYYEIGGFGDKNRMLRRKPGTYEFEFVSIIPEAFSPIGSVDVDLNGIPDILGDSSGSVLDFEAPVRGSRNISLKRTWVGMAGVRQVPRFEDLDNDGYPEILMYQFGLGLHGVAIIKYRQETKRLEKVFEYTYPNNHDIRGCWAIGDFDKDGHKEFVTATNEGEVCFIENGAGEGNYRLSFVDTTRYMNVGVYTEGNDLDGDGRSECLVGSGNTFGLTNIAVYETIGNNAYEVTCWIEVFPVGALVWELMWTGDIDGDGKDEIVLSSGSILVVLKAFGIADYRAVWYRNFNSGISHRLFDIDNDGIQEILLSFVEDKVHQTMILKHPVAVSVTGAPFVPDKLECSISPQPASGNGNTLLHVTGSGAIHLSLRSIDGREMHERTIEPSSGGRHTIPLQMREYPSGVYYAVLTAGKSTIVRKFQVIQ